MPRVAVCLGLSVLSACSAGDGGVMFVDGGVVFVDGGVVFVDGGVAERIEDGGVAVIDGGVVEVVRDGGVVFIDGGVGRADGGVSVIDGGVSVIDGGVAVIDGGVGVIDGGVSVIDGGVSVIDGGIVDTGVLDAGVQGSGLLALYHFDEASGDVARDSSGNGRDGVFVNFGAGIDRADGRLGRAAELAGFDGRVRAPDLELLSSFTIAAWVRNTSLSAVARLPIVSKQTVSSTAASDATLAYEVYLLDGRIEVTLDGRPVRFPSTQSVIRPNAWTHVAVTYDGATVEAYVNGVSRTGAPHVRVPRRGPGPLLIGGHDDASAPRELMGRIDEVQIHGRALSPGEIADLALGLGVMVRIEAGTFVMGSPPAELGRDADETEHPVTLTRPYYLGVTEISQADAQALLGAPISGLPFCLDCPADSVTWYQAAAYANALSRRTGLPDCYLCTGGECRAARDPYTCPGYRLPTEAEWERAARGGVPAPFFSGGALPPGPLPTCNDLVTLTDGTPLGMLGWYCSTAMLTGPVGTLRANPFGLYDVHGNVAEWTQDLYAADLGMTAATDPRGALFGGIYTARGGAWSELAQYQRSARRLPLPPASADTRVGFRLARSAPP